MFKAGLKINKQFKRRLLRRLVLSIKSEDDGLLAAL